MSGIQLTTLVVIGTDCTGSCESNYHMITTTTAPGLIHVYPTTYDGPQEKGSKSINSRFTNNYLNPNDPQLNRPEYS